MKINHLVVTFIIFLALVAKSSSDAKVINATSESVESKPSRQFISEMMDGLTAIFNKSLNDEVKNDDRSMKDESQNHEKKEDKQKISEKCDF